MGDRFRLVFAGDVLDGHRLEDVQQKMADLLRLSKVRQASMFSGKRTVLKRRMAFDDATRYVTKFERIGARVVVEPDEDTPRAPKPPVVAAPAPPAVPKAPSRLAPWFAGAAVAVFALVAGWATVDGQGASPLAPRVTEERLAAYGLSAPARDAFRTTYWPAGGNKAFAASTGGAWGLVAGAATDQDAAQRALVDCEGRRRGAGPACRLVDLTGNWAPVTP